MTDNTEYEIVRINGAGLKLRKLNGSEITTFAIVVRETMTFDDPLPLIEVGATADNLNHTINTLRSALNLLINTADTRAREQGGEGP